MNVSPELILSLSQDEEPRVRGAVADCIGVIARQRGTAVFDAVCPQITASIQSSFVSTSHVPPLHLPCTKPPEACMSEDITHSLCA